MQKNGSFSREKSSNLDSVAIISLCVLGCGGQTATVDPFMPPESSAEPSVGLHWPTSCWASPPVTPFRTSLLSSGFNDWSWAPWGHRLICFLVSSWGAGSVAFGIPLDKWEEPFKQFLALSFSEELFRETAGLFWMGAVLELETGFTLMGRRSIPEATRFSIRPPKISIAPGDGEERKIRTFTGFIGIPQCKNTFLKKQKWNAVVKWKTVRYTSYSTAIATLPSILIQKQLGERCEGKGQTHSRTSDCIRRCQPLSEVQRCDHGEGLIQQCETHSYNDKRRLLLLSWLVV